MCKRFASSGFTLVELIAVVVILAVLAVAVSPRFMSAETPDIQTTRDNIIMAFSQAQQIAMAQGEAKVVLTNTTVDVQVPDPNTSVWDSAKWPGVRYPDNLPARVTITKGIGDWTFDKLGRPKDKLGTSQEDRSIAINGQPSITVEESGYAH